MDKILEELKEMEKINEKVERGLEYERQIKAKEENVKRLYENLQLKMIGSIDRENAQNEYDSNKANLEKLKELKKGFDEEVKSDFEEKKQKITEKINNEIELYEKNKQMNEKTNIARNERDEEVKTLESQKNAYSKIAENSKKDIDNIMAQLNNGENVSMTRLTDARNEYNANSKKVKEIDSQIENLSAKQFKLIDFNEEELSDLSYLKIRLSSLKLEDIDKLKDDLFVIKYDKDENNTKNENETKSEDENKAKNENKTKSKDANESKNGNETKSESKGKNENNKLENNLTGLDNKIINETQREENEEKSNDENKTRTIKMIISRKPEIKTDKYSIRIGKIKKLIKQDKEDISEKLQKIFKGESIEELNKIEEISKTVDPMLLEEIIELKNKNILTENQIKNIIPKLANNDVKKEDLGFKIVYDMEDLSKGAFLPWNGKERNMIAKIAEKNREIGIAEFKDGKEFEPNPIKRMLEKVKQRKLGKGKEQEVEIEEVNEEDVEKKSRFTNPFKNRIKEKAKTKSIYEQLRDESYNSKNSSEIIKRAKEAVVNGEITSTELIGIMNLVKNNQNKESQQEEQEEQEEQK
jgi:erythrocyte membrane-associated giant protein antigen 332